MERTTAKGVLRCTRWPECDEVRFGRIVRYSGVTVSSKQPERRPLVVR